jgi:hypothetical protein
VEDDPLEEWPPPEARVRAAVWAAEGHLERREYVAASNTLSDALPGAPPSERPLLLGLRHLAAAGYRAQTHDRERARRQLAHARRRLTGLPDVSELVELVAREVETSR